MAARLLELHRSYRAKQHQIKASGYLFNSAGTLDGGVDLAIQCGNGSHLTYNISIGEARSLATLLISVAEDVERNCLYGRDALMNREGK